MIAYKATGGTINIDFPLCAKADPASSGNTPRYKCNDVAGMVAFVYVDLTGTHTINDAQWDKDVKTWFGTDKYKQTTDQVDPLIYGADGTSIPLKSIFATTKTKQTFKARYFTDSTTNQLILFGEVSDPGGSWAEFDFEIPVTGGSSDKANKYILNADWGVLAIGISDALFAHK